MEITIREIEVQKLNVAPGEVLFVKVSGPDFDDPVIRQSFHNALSKTFPANRVFVVSLDEKHKIEFTPIAIQKEEAQGCETTEVGYCSSCNCGKKEAVLAARPKAEMTVTEEEKKEFAKDADAQPFPMKIHPGNVVLDAAVEAPTVGDPDTLEQILAEFKATKEEQKSAIDLINSLEVKKIYGGNDGSNS